MNKKLAAILFGAAMIAATCASAEDKIADVTDMQALRNAMKADKRAYVEKTLALTSAEAKAFWPIYDSYERVMEDTSRRRVVALKDLVFRDSPTTNLAAKNLTQELVSIYDTEAKARLRLARRVMRALPPVKAARYLQLEDKMLAVRDYDEASAVPLIR